MKLSHACFKYLLIKINCCKFVKNDIMAGRSVVIGEQRFTTGDRVICSLDLGKSNQYDSINGLPFEGVVHVYSKNLFWVCHNMPNAIGNKAANLHGYTYSFHSEVLNGVMTTKGISLSPNPIGVSEVKTDYKIKSFLLKDNPHIFNLFNLDLEVIDKKSTISSADEGFVEITNPYGKKVKIKLARLIRKLIVAYNKIVNGKFKKLDESDAFLEKLHNDWVSSHKELEFKIKKGKELLEGYTGSNYHKKGNLRSCMTNNFSGLKLYTENPEQVNIMIFYLEDMIVGRCILWKRKEDGVWCHDRVYSSFDWIRPSLFQILKANKHPNIWRTKEKCHVVVDSPITVLPYLDTMKLVNKTTRSLRAR